MTPLCPTRRAAELARWGGRVRALALRGLALRGSMSVGVRADLCVAMTVAMAMAVTVRVRVGVGVCVALLDVGVVLLHLLLIEAMIVRVPVRLVQAVRVEIGGAHV